eukprot:CAMPEP_0114499700 /NCGR_PEP_ID=MMETSP0109-20121206/7563_1 /TAXON_ID=29199 /ORGANISM="Chlorarachnion reptans, Strain CCCM449" /LENGTH=786 /DNA_ID=CAMNT_0001677297 /DNA_START=24 /DNA_END=2384 /DNA_ORIENTATION=+
MSLAPPPQLKILAGLDVGGRGGAGGVAFTEIQIREDDGLEALLEAAGKALGTEVYEAVESVYRARIEDTEELMPGDKILFKPVKVHTADIALCVPGAKVFSIREGKNSPLATGPLELLLLTGPGQTRPHLLFRVGADFHYSLNADPDQKGGAERDQLSMLPVVIHDKRHLVVPGKAEGEFFGIALPPDTGDGMLEAVKEIVEEHAFLNLGSGVENASDVRQMKEDAKTDSNTSRVLEGLKAQAVAFLLSAQAAGGEVQESAIVKTVYSAGKQASSKALDFARDVSLEITKSVQSLGKDITKYKDEKDSSFTSAVATVLSQRATTAAHGAGAAAQKITIDVKEKVTELIDESRNEEGSVSPTELAMVLGKHGVEVVKGSASKAGELTKKGLVLVKTNIDELKLAERLSHAQATGMQGIEHLSATVGGLLESAKKSGSENSTLLIEKLKELNNKIDVLKRAQAVGSWTSDKVSESYVGVKKATAEIQKMVKDKHVHMALQQGLSTLVVAVAETGSAIQEAGKDKKSTGEKMEAYIETGAGLTVQGIEASTKVMTTGIRIGKSYLKQQIGHSTKGVKIPDEVKAAVLKAQQYSVGAAVISDALVKELVGNAGQIADRIATGMAVAASTVNVPSTSSSSGTGRLRMLAKIQGPVGDAAKSAEKVVAKAAESWTDVVLAMRNAGITLVQELGDASTDIAQHRFGSEVGDVVHAGVETYTNVTKAMTNVAQVSDFKGIAKRQAQTALKTATAAYTEATSEAKESDAKIDAPTVNDTNVGNGDLAGNGSSSEK